MTKLKTIKLALLLLILPAIARCGGSSGSDSEDTLFAACAELSTGTKLINGETCSINDSAIANVQIRTNTNSTSFCSGAIISPTEVVTAAHCFPEDGIGVTQVSIQSGMFTRVAASFVIHPDFKIDFVRQAIFNDIALIKFSSALPFEPLALLGSRAARSGEAGIIAGYGIDESGNAGGLQAGTAFITDVSENHIFLAFDGNRGSNPCFGDSGGPLLLRQNSRFAIAGIVSTGRSDVENCGEGDVTLFSAVFNTDILNFILTQSFLAEVI